MPVMKNCLANGPSTRQHISMREGIVKSEKEMKIGLKTLIIPRVRMVGIKAIKSQKNACNNTTSIPLFPLRGSPVTNALNLC